MSLLRLFFIFLQIGFFSIGGGYAVIPMISQEVVSSQHWLSAQEFTDIITISQMTPGPLAVNTSTFVGMRVAGIYGALCATMGCISIGVIIAYGIYHIFQRFSSSPIFMEILKGLKAGSLGLIMAAAAIIVSLAFFKEGKIAIKAVQIPAILIFLLILFISRKWKANPIVLMMLSGIMGIMFYL
ncbi:chromate transporter [Erysipelotrichaceae bacterium AM07-12]|uniref:chromate transporter n=1 Tax=Longicatena caecimuris TaxID=1796635 RepID=UPI000E41C072|nr:chromate transporter [Longicatena caecimuris]RGD43210.1 chromate transporter [Erysipelotrichaceae bacterium AM07-12]RGD45820.1 chromate transporter [Erysipelotrichaceae bacterium AM07-35-1]